MQTYKVAEAIGFIKGLVIGAFFVSMLWILNTDPTGLDRPTPRRTKVVDPEPAEHLGPI